MKSSVLITGGGGFVARHLAPVLSKSSHVFVHMRKASEGAVIKNQDGITVLEGSLRPEEIAQYIGVEVGTLFHLAGAVSAKDTMDLFDANVVTTVNAIELMERCSIPHMFFLSTAAVWSGTIEGILSESVPPEPDTPYGYAKLSAETLIIDAVKHGKIRSATILRCNNTYGPGSTQGVVANFYEKINTGHPVTINGDGMQLREPLYIADLVDLLVLAKANPVDGVRTFGVSGPQALTISQLAQTIANTLGRNLVIDFAPARGDRSRHLLVSTQKAKLEFGWQPETYIENGIRQLMDVNFPEKLRSE
jgi:UDP-glucose 4-epimerase